MPLHVDHNPKTDYNQQILVVGGRRLLVEATARQRFCTVQAMGVKQFRRQLRWPTKSTENFVLVQVSSSEPSARKSSSKAKLLDEDNEALRKILDDHDGVFKYELSSGWPPVLFVDHAVETDPTARPSHRLLYQLSPAELVAAREYVDKLLFSGRVRQKTSPYGDLFALFWSLDGNWEMWRIAKLWIGSPSTKMHLSRDVKKFLTGSGSHSSFLNCNWRLHVTKSDYNQQKSRRRHLTRNIVSSSIWWCD